MQLAYSRIGSGPQLVKTGNWMTHLEFDFQSPIWRHLFRELSRDHTLIRYDARGNGLSDRNVEDVSFETSVKLTVWVTLRDGHAMMPRNQRAQPRSGRKPEDCALLVVFDDHRIARQSRARIFQHRQEADALDAIVGLHLDPIENCRRDIERAGKHVGASAAQTRGSAQMNGTRVMAS